MVYPQGDVEIEKYYRERNNIWLYPLSNIEKERSLRYYQDTFREKKNFKECDRVQILIDSIGDTGLWTDKIENNGNNSNNIEIIIPNYCILSNTIPIQLSLNDNRTIEKCIPSFFNGLNINGKKIISINGENIVNKTADQIIELLTKYVYDMNTDVTLQLSSEIGGKRVKSKKKIKSKKLKSKKNLKSKN